MHRWLLAPFPALAGWMGLAYVFGDPGRTQSQSFKAAQSIATMPQWGLLFLLGSFLLTICLILDEKKWLSRALWCGGAIFTWWAALFGYSAATDPTASLTGPAIHGTIGILQFIGAWWIGKDA